MHPSLEKSVLKRGTHRLGCSCDCCGMVAPKHTDYRTDIATIVHFLRRTNLASPGLSLALPQRLIPAHFEEYHSGLHESCYAMLYGWTLDGHYYSWSVYCCFDSILPGLHIRNPELDCLSYLLRASDNGCYYCSCVVSATEPIAGQVLIVSALSLAQ